MAQNSEQESPCDEGGVLVHIEDREGEGSDVEYSDNSGSAFNNGEGNNDAQYVVYSPTYNNMSHSNKSNRGSSFDSFGNYTNNPQVYEVRKSAFDNKTRNQIHPSKIARSWRTASTTSPTSQSTISPNSQATTSSVSHPVTSPFSPSHAPSMSRRMEIVSFENWRDPHISETITEIDDEVLRKAQDDMVANIPQHVQAIAAAIQMERDTVVKRFGPGIIQDFKPSYSALQGCGLLPDLNEFRSHVSSIHYGGSGNYLGDITLHGNRSADIPDSANCALWVVGLPANVTYTTLLQSIRNVGKIYATMINAPTGPHSTSAAKIVLFDRPSAERLYVKMLSGNFRVLGNIVSNVRWNKIKSGTHPHPEQSRAIRIVGARHLMSFDYFTSFFSTRFTYHIERTISVPCEDVDSNGQTMVAHEWHFGSLRCQAVSAKLAIEREFPKIFKVSWARDSCE